MSVIKSRIVVDGIKLKVIEQTVYRITIKLGGYEFDSLARWDSERDAIEVKELFEEQLEAKLKGGEKE